MSSTKGILTNAKLKRPIKFVTALRVSSTYTLIVEHSKPYELTTNVHVSVTSPVVTTFYPSLYEFLQDWEVLPC